MTRQWYSVSFNSQNEDGERIMLPRKSRWGGWKFKHPGNLLEFSRGIVRVRFHDGWVFRLYRKYDGEWKHQNLTATEFLAVYDSTETNLSDNYYESFYEETVPDVLKPVLVEVADDLAY